MNKPYSGNGKPFVLALFAPEDRAKVLPVLEALEKKGLVLCGQDGRVTESQAKKACTTVTFLSEAFAKDTAKQQVFFTADAARMPVIPVRLDSAKQPEVLERSITAKNAILAERYSAEELANRIAGAESLNPPKLTPAQQKGNRLRIGLILTAALLALAAAVFIVGDQLGLWDNLKPTPTPDITAVPETPTLTQEPTDTPAPTPSPTPIVPQAVTEKYGIVDADLNFITRVVIVGNRFLFWKPAEYEENPDVFSLASQGFDENDNSAWFSNEDGHRMERTAYDDLDFLTLLPQLKSINVALADLSRMPDLKSLKHLDDVHLYDCTVENLDWLEGCRIVAFIADRTELDLTPLSSCESLKEVRLECHTCRNTDLSRFAPPNLQYFYLQSANELQNLDLSSLSACEKLEILELNFLNLRSIQFVEGLSQLRQLSLNQVNGLSDLTPLNSLTGLTTLEIQNCDNVRDYSSIAGCTGLTDLNLQCNWEHRIRNADWIAGMPNIQRIGLYGCQLNDVNFLDGIPTYRDIVFGFAGSIRDYSALGRHKSYDHLHINPETHDYSAIAEYLRDATVASMQLYDIQKVDLSMLPAITDTLEIYYGSLENLQGLDEMKQRNMGGLKLIDMQRLTSLEGIENLPMLSKRDGTFLLEIAGCPRLTDYSALDGTFLAKLALSQTYMVPDLSRFRTNELELDHVEGLEDLTCLEAIDPANRINLYLYVPDEITDLMPARNLKGNYLKVSPQLGEQAQALVDEGHFRMMEISYPDHQWQLDDRGFTLLNLEEIDTLPAAVLAKVNRLTLAGDMLVDPDNQGIGCYWMEGRDEEVWQIDDHLTGEVTEIKSGTMANLSRIAKLTGLRSLCIVSQPLESLDGIDGMVNLEVFSLQNCPQLADISALFTLESLRQLEIDAPVESIQGIQNLMMLNRLKLSNTHVTDLSPLSECDFSAAEREGGLTLEIFGDTHIGDYSPLENIKSFNTINLNAEPESWISHLQGATVYELNLNPSEVEDLSFLSGITIRKLRVDCFENLRSLHGLEANLESGQMERLEILGCPRLLDWSVLQNGSLGKLWLYSTFEIPDLSGMNIETLRLEQLDWLTDLSALETLWEDRNISLELLRLPMLEDLSALKKIKGERLAVSEDLEQKAKRYAGNFRSFELAETDWWGPSHSTELFIRSFDDLETLSSGVLKQVRSLQIIGDKILNRNGSEWYGHYWDEKRNKEIPVINNHENGEQQEVETGSMTDLHQLEKLENLLYLTIVAQPLESLEGIEKLTHLQELRLNFCEKLTDLSPVYSLPDMEVLEIDYCNKLTSIEGIGALKKLWRLSVGNQVRNLNPLLEVDFSYSQNQAGGFVFSTTNEKTKDFSPLKAVPCFSELNLGGMNNDKWISVVKDSRILRLTWFGFKNQKQFESFLADHPELESLNIAWCRAITDLSKLLDMPKLKHVVISPEGMEKAEQSLDGKEYSFKLQKQ